MIILDNVRCIPHSLGGTGHGTGDAYPHGVPLSRAHPSGGSRAAAPYCRVPGNAQCAQVTCREPSLHAVE